MQATEELLLPCQPRTLALLLRELAVAAPNLRRINQLFGGDPVLALQLLECANASPYQMVGQVSGIAQALTLLGERQLHTLLKKAQTAVTARPAKAMDMAQFARTSQDCARLARNVAGLVRLDASLAYAAGLLHAMGQLVLHYQQAGDVAQVTQEVALWDPRRARVELRMWGYSAGSVSATLLQTCGLPAEMVAAVHTMDAPLQTERFNPMAGVLHLAAWCCRARASVWAERLMADAFPVEVAAALGVDMDVVLQQDHADWSRSLY